VKNADALHLQQMAALVVTGIILYVPANVLPVMTMTIAGDVQPLTVMGGVQELYDSGLAPIAGIVFIASILVPFCKLACLSWLLLMHGASTWRRERSIMRRILHTIGSWSMIDVFLGSVLVAVGQLGALANVQAEPGAFFFAAVLVCSLFATDIYKTRLIWQRGEHSRR
jgi:paraquat-inducible protein A